MHQINLTKRQYEDLFPEVALREDIRRWLNDTIGAGHPRTSYGFMTPLRDEWDIMFTSSIGETDAFLRFQTEAAAMRFKLRWL